MAVNPTGLGLLRTGDQRSMLRPIALAVLSTAMFAAAAAGAEAKVFRGKTSQGRPASVVIGSDGLLRAARVNWRGRCRYGRLGDKTIFTRPHDASTPDAFADAGRYRRRDGAGYRLRFDVGARGTRVADARGERWRISFRAKVLVTRRGRYVDTCRSGRLRATLRPT
jgi:hypothetical protein